MFVVHRKLLKNGEASAWQAVARYSYKMMEIGRLPIRQVVGQRFEA
jgi:hypothetical protein